MRLPLLALLLATAFAALTQRAQAQDAGCTGPASQTRLFVNVSNVRNGNGLIAVTLYADDKSKFLAKRGSLYVGRVPANAGTTRACIHLPKPGVYALAVYHDEDADRKLKRKGIGLPAEGYGFSNNARTMFSLPAFRAVRFNAPRTNMETNVRLKYP
ncbi:DUF2141 domain-containing protein [Sphingomonas sp.]|jgi:uncharacterized protein (DUF2141 family)|uniref:DUF2141 domain-containing protein n=1 Tax=Sphingomonas sp. TaxID=28214 RepID=UPI002D7E7AC6|nr:DUF2141 domain-containing protein [Sphingomonas sp.]HEU0045688.1 DUF2141 domain-containing protein [Sphingomonas sp.]